PVGWSSPSVYSNGDTMQAVAAEGITYTIDQMDSDIISRLKTPDGSLIQLPYPVVTVDMGQHLARMKMPAELETLWLDYVLELAGEARADPAREATTGVIAIHPFVIGTPDGAAVLRRVLSRLKKDDQVWLTDTDAILKAAGLKRWRWLPPRVRSNPPAPRRPPTAICSWRSASTTRQANDHPLST